MASARERARTAALNAAAGIVVPERCDVCVIGGGASGLVAALTSARAGAAVVVLEQGYECGRTILATGNGRCNLAHADLAVALDKEAGRAVAYHNADFAAIVMGTTPTADVVRLFDGLGLDVVADEDGRLYPASRVAESVRTVLLDACARQGVVLAAARQAHAVMLGEGRLRPGAVVRYDERWQGGARDVRLACDSVVVACGGALTGGSGNDDDGLLASIDVPLVSARPALCPLACDGVPAALDGRRTRCVVTLLRDGDVVARERGEVLFRRYGLSGIIMLDLSRVAAPGDVVSLDLVPDWAEERLHDRLRHLREAGVPLEVQLVGLIDPAIARVLAKRAGAGTACAPRAQRGVARMLKDLRFVVAGTADEAHAQVTHGGVNVDALDPATLSVCTPRAANVHFCGEVVDVDGPCGGYNLGWAWKSGMVAGTAAAAGRKSY